MICRSASRNKDKVVVRANDLTSADLADVKKCQKFDITQRHEQGGSTPTTLYDRFQCITIRLSPTKTVVDTTHAFSIYRLERKSDIGFIFFLTFYE